MKYRVISYITICGRREIVELPDSAYGEWIIYENKVPKYHIDCFREHSESDKIVNRILDRKKESINSIIEKINSTYGLRLSLEPLSLFAIKIRSQLKKMELYSLPLEWITGIEKISDGSN